MYSQEFAEIAIATLPRDRWGSLQLAEGQSQGTVWSAPITLPKEGCSIVLNADKVQGLTIELADEDKNLLKGYSNDQKGMSGRGKSLDRHVKWDDKNLKALGGKTVRLKINVSNAKTKLFAVYLDSKK